MFTLRMMLTLTESESGVGKSEVVGRAGVELGGTGVEG